MIDPNTWDMILGKAGHLPGKLDPEIVALAKEKGFEFFEGNPQDNYPNVLPKYIKEMEELGWERGQDDEELFEFAMHDKQYREYKSGEAKKRFNAELQQKMEAKFKASGAAVQVPDFRALRHPNAEPIAATASGRLLWEFDYLDKSVKPAEGKHYKEGDFLCAIQTNGRGLEVMPALFAGKIVEPKEQGTMVQKGDIVAYIEK